VLRRMQRGQAQAECSYAKSRKFPQGIIRLAECRQS
jgi:hypothetical protein